jgi:hypothetical protein
LHKNQHLKRGLSLKKTDGRLKGALVGKSGGVPLSEKIVS